MNGLGRIFGAVCALGLLPAARGIQAPAMPGSSLQAPITPAPITQAPATQAPATQSSAAPANAVPTAEFRFQRPVATVPAYTITVGANGRGTYTEGAAQEANDPVTIHVSPATMEKIFGARNGFGTKPCETRQKNIADTGRKTLSFSGDGAPASCTFNFSDTPLLNEVAGTFIAIGETLQAGERLAAKHRFDRLGLDMEIEILNTEVKGGRALEVGNIGPVLRSIAEDDRVIERVRRTATRLLQDSAPALVGTGGKVVPGSSDR